ncbi:ankyrin, partial [Colletotrichum somersetense]
VDVRDSEGNTALHTAVANGKLVVVLRLLSYGADPNVENAIGWTPVHVAVRMGSVDLVEALVTHGGD